MKFKVTKIAAAVAAGLGVSFVGMNAAQADAVLFPYFAVSDTVTTLISTVNLAEPGAVSSVNPQTLHYRFYYKRNAAAENLTATCEEFDVRRVTSPNDVVTFDLLGHAGDDLGVLFEPADRQLKANYNAANRSFALMSGLTPARGFMIVDNEEAVNRSFEGSLNGEAIVLDFSEGAAWGYQAYNAAPQANVGNTTDRFLFEDAAETLGEVLAGNRIVSPAAQNGSKSVVVPVAVMPIASDATSGDTITKFFVTPIAHSVQDAPAAPATPTRVVQANGQLNGDLRTQLKLQVEYDTTTVNDVMFDRDENPVSGQTPQNVVCVGAVPVQSMLSAGALREIGNFGGWTGVQVLSPGALATFGGTPAVPVTRTKDTNQAVVIKLEYNANVQFLGETFPGAFNNALWLRNGIRESVASLPAPTGVVPPAPSLTLRAAADANGTPVFVANDFVGNQISVLQ